MHSKDGIVSFWSPTGELKRVKKDVVSSFVRILFVKIGFFNKLFQIEKRTVIKDKGDKQDTKRTRTKWITDYLILTEFNKIVLGTGFAKKFDL